MFAILRLGVFRKRKVAVSLLRSLWKRLNGATD